MSDDLTPEAEEATETPEVQGTQPESSEDIGALKRALEHEREERRQAKEALRRLDEDEDARREWLEKHGYTIADDEPVADDDEYDDDDDPRWAQLQELKAWQEQETQRQATEHAKAEWAGWEDFVKGKAEAAGIELTKRDIKALRLDSAADGGRPVGPDKAVEALNEHLADIRSYQEEIRTPKRKKKAPHVLPGGTTATGVPDYSDMTRDQVNDQMVERVRALESQS